MNFTKILALILLTASTLVGCKRNRSSDWESGSPPPPPPNQPGWSGSQPPPPPPNQPGWGSNQPPPPPGGPGWNDGNDDWRPQRWVQVGYQQIDNRNPRRVTLNSRADGRFRQIRLTTNRGDLEVYDLSVRLANGRVFTPDFRQVFDSRTHTRVIDLPGTTRSIDQVRFMCRAINRNERPVITIFAR